MKSICLILPWFGGPFKNYFQFFLESCRNNPTINWLIFTDSSQIFDFPENVRVCYCSFEWIKRKIQEKFDFQISLERPYKLCDFKPAYGEIFAEELKDFDFWGYCDCDLIFGNIRNFVTEEILEKYEKIFSRGHFSLYKNETGTNSFYRTLNYKEVFSNDKGYSFDEWPGISGAWEKSGKDYYDELAMDDIRVGFRAFRLTKEISDKTGPYHRKNKNISGICKKMKNVFYRYRNGSLFRCYNLNGKSCSDEVLYVHFQKRNLAICENLQQYDNYCIANNCFLNESHLFDSQSIKNLLIDSITMVKIRLKSLVKNIC